MLYNPKWSTTPSLDGFIAWLREQDPDKAYRFSNCEGACCLGQYMISLGIRWGWDYNTNNNTTYMTTCIAVFGSEEEFSVLCQKPNTFGAALTRALAYRASL